MTTMTKSSLVGRRPLSLNNRVMLFVAIAITLSLLMIGYLVQSAIERHFREQDADELAVITHAVEVALEKASIEGAVKKEVLAEAVTGHHGVYFQIWDESQQLIYGPTDILPTTHINAYEPLDTIDANHLYRWSVKDKTFHASVMQSEIGGRQYRIVAAIDMEFHLLFLESFHRTLWVIMSLAGVFTLLAAWFGVHQGHSPIRKLRDSIGDIQVDRLDRRLDTSTVPSELVTLVDSFNHMISRLEESFVKLSHFSADIAHELRTPLTNIITQTQVVMGKSRSPEEYRELHYSNLEELERLAKMVNDMLWLAQSEHGLLKPTRETLDLADEVKELFDFFEALADEKHIQLVLEGQAPSIQGDRALLRRAISNLLSNAIRYTPDGEKVLVKLTESKEGGTLLSVQNSGPIIPPEHLSKIFDRFYRVDPSRKRHSDGAGLGLAIVKSIVEAHEGTIEVSSVHGVTSFTMGLSPAASD